MIKSNHSFRKLTQWIWILFFLGIQPCSALELTEWVIGSTSFQTLPGFGLGGGASIRFTLSQMWMIETGLFYTARNYSQIPSQGLKANYGMPGAHFPIVLRYRLSEMSSLGVGPYLTQGSGSVQVTQDGETRGVGYSELQVQRLDWGLVTSFQFRILINEFMHLNFDERIVFGLRNLDSTDNGSLLTRDFQSWIGVSFTL